MKGDNQNICILTKDGKSKRIKRSEAEKLVNTGKAKFISKTKFKILDSGIKIPNKILNEGDAAIKDFLKKSLSKREQENRKKAKDAVDKTDDGEGRLESRKKKDKSHNKRKRSDRRGKTRNQN